MFDLNKILVGSHGTICILTEITLKLVPENKHTRLAAVLLYDLAPLGRLVDEILKEAPETLETYDDKTVRLAVKFFPDFLKNKGLKDMAAFARSFFEEVRMVFGSFFGGEVPKLVILAEFAGEDERELDEKCEKLKARLQPFKVKINITKNKVEENKYWDIRRQNFSLLRKHMKKLHTMTFIDDVIVRPEFLPKFIPELKSILDSYKVVYCLAGHAGDGNFHIFPLMDFKRPGSEKTILEIGEKVFDLVAKYHGSLAAEHNDGLVRTPYLPKMYGDKMTEVFRKIKEIFDPDNILNPGKKVPTANQGGTKEYIATHIAKS